MTSKQEIKSNYEMGGLDTALALGASVRPAKTMRGYSTTSANNK